MKEEQEKEVYVIINKQYLDTVINSLKHLEIMLMKMEDHQKSILDHQMTVKQYISEIRDYTEEISQQEDSIEQVKT